MEVLKSLVAKVARAFYDPKYIVILDALNNAPPNSNGIREDDLAPVLKMTTREIHKLCGKLKEHRLVRSGTRLENRKQDQRPIPKTFYYLDYKEFVDVVKWKMYKMQMIVRDNLRTESENQGFICDLCKATFTPLDVLSLVNPSDGLFYCDVCESVLKENDNAENVKESQQELARLREQSHPIITLLKQTDSIVIPQSYIFKHGLGPRKSGPGGDQYELAIAQDTGAGQGDIIVDLQMDNEAARRAKQLEAEEKRQQNALPIWHQRSTVSDVLLDSGEQASTLTADEEEDHFEEMDNTEVDTDTQDYYAKYYASLSEAQPLDDDLPADQDQLQYEEFEEEDEFETVNPDESLKREYSQDNDDDIEDESNKRAKLNVEEEEIDGAEEFIDGDEEIPLVSVNGKMVPLNEVMEDDQRNMTTEEYKAYYEAWQNWQTN